MQFHDIARVESDTDDPVECAGDCARKQHSINFTYYNRHDLKALECQFIADRNDERNTHSELIAVFECIKL